MTFGDSTPVIWALRSLNLSAGESVTGRPCFGPECVAKLEAEAPVAQYSNPN